MRKSLSAIVLLVILVAVSHPAIAAPRAASPASSNVSIVSLFLALVMDHPASWPVSFTTPAARRSLRTTRAAACVGVYPSPRFGNCP